MKKGEFAIADNRPAAREVYHMRLEGDASAMRRPGQFVNIEIPGLYLRRPLSVFDWGEGYLEVVYKVVGQGTQKLCEMRPGERLDVLTGLGNGFEIECAGERPLLVGGGVGVPPLYALARRLLERGCRPVAALGFNSAQDVFCADELRRLGCEVRLCTLDGSCGARGTVMRALEELEACSYFYACGPAPMLRALEALPWPGEMSFEERMGCGFGACMGCSVMTRGGARRVCKDGPVFKKGEMLWQTRA